MIFFECHSIGPCSTTVMFYYCQPMDERMNDCSLEEKKQFTQLMFSNIRNSLREPYPKIARLAPNYFTEIGFAIYPQMGRTLSLLHFAATLGCIMARIFAILIIIQVTFCTLTVVFCQIGTASLLPFSQ